MHALVGIERLQGDFSDEIGEMILKEFKEISENDIKYVDKSK